MLSVESVYTHTRVYWTYLSMHLYIPRRNIVFDAHAFFVYTHMYVCTHAMCIHAMVSMCLFPSVCFCFYSYVCGYGNYICKSYGYTNIHLALRSSTTSTCPNYDSLNIYLSVQYTCACANEQYTTMNENVWVCVQLTSALMRASPRHTITITVAVTTKGIVRQARWQSGISVCIAKSWHFTIIHKCLTYLLAWVLPQEPHCVLDLLPLRRFELAGMRKRNLWTHLCLFSWVLQQSTSRPGCVVQVRDILSSFDLR